MTRFGAKLLGVTDKLLSVRKACLMVPLVWLVHSQYFNLQDIAWNKLFLLCSIHQFECEETEAQRGSPKPYSKWQSGDSHPSILPLELIV
jgi:hypothetical protein